MRAKIAVIAEALNHTQRAFYAGSASLRDVPDDSACRSHASWRDVILANNSRIVHSLCRRATAGGGIYDARAPGNGPFVFACKENLCGFECPVAALEAVAISLSAEYPMSLVEREIVTETYVVGSLGGAPGPMNPPLFSTGATAMMERHGSVLFVLPTSGALSPAECHAIVDDAAGVPRSSLIRNTIPP